MTDQLALLDLPPLLTPNQQRVLDALRAAGRDGMTACEVGELLYPHARVGWAGFGRSVLQALAAKGLACRRRARGDIAGAWLAAGVPDDGTLPGMLPASEPLPF